MPRTPAEPPVGTGLARERLPLLTSRDVRRADVNYLILSLGSVIGVILVLPSGLTIINAADPTENLAAVMGIIVGGIVLFGSWVVGGVMAIKKRWNRPLFWIGLYTLLVVGNALHLLLADVLSSGQMYQSSVGRAWVAGSRYLGLPVPVLAIVFCIVWFVRGRRRVLLSIGDGASRSRQPTGHQRVHT